MIWEGAPASRESTYTPEAVSEKARERIRSLEKCADGLAEVVAKNRVHRDLIGEVIRYLKLHDFNPTERASDGSLDGVEVLALSGEEGVAGEKGVAVELFVDGRKVKRMEVKTTPETL